MADLPFLGCKISLISKCDIRYEGILYCVDAKESTIALSKVRSYGTETRGDPNSYVAPKNDVYDIIIFRASDVKDLRVDGPQPPGLTDPAIISAHHSYPGPTTSSFNSTSNATSTTTNNINTNPGAPTLNSNGSLSASGSSNQQQQQKQHQHQKPLLPFMPTGSSNSNNTTNNNKADQQQQPLSTINYSSAVSNAQRNRSNRPEQRDKRSEDVNSTANNAASSTNLNLKKLTGHDRDNLNSRRDDRRPDNKRDDRRDERRNDRRYERRDERRDDRRIGSDRRGVEDRDLGGRRGDGRSNMSRAPRAAYDGGNRNHVNSRYNPNNYNPRRGPSNRDENSKGDRPIYRRGPMQGNRRARSGERTGAPRGHRKGAPLKFEGEYDFDEANKLFLELESKFKGLKLKSGEEKDAESLGEGNNSKSPVGQSESGSGYDSEDQNQKEGDSKAESVSGDFYDRTKSFFDNISCEASERSQGKVNKPDWRKERQLNAETFGVSVNYRRGGYRGRAFGANGYHRR